MKSFLRHDRGSPRCVIAASVLLLILGTFPVRFHRTTAAAGVSVRWFSFEPSVLSTNASGLVKYSVKVEGSPTSIQLELSAGGIVELINDGSGMWSAMVPVSQALFDYQADDANHNFVGFLRLFEGAVQGPRYNVFANVKDNSIGAVAIVDRPPLRITRHIVNIWRSDLAPVSTMTGDFGAQVISVVRQFYQNFGDDYDFINVVVALPSFFENRYHFVVKNTIQGLGLPQSNNTAQYGSSGRLLGISVFPLDGLFDLAESGANHELGHQWINYSTQSLLRPGRPHWPVSTLARGIMGLSIPGSGAGGAFPFTIVQQPDSSYRFQRADQMDEFNDLELYLMGMAPPEQVGNHLVPENQIQSACHDCVVQGQVRTVTINDVITVDGPRVPNSAASQKEFRIATIVVSRDRALNDDEMAFMDYFAARGEATTAVRYSSGLVKGITKPFKLATKGNGTLLTSLVTDLPFGPALSSVQIFKKAKQVDHLIAEAKWKKFRLEISGASFDAGAKILLNGIEAETIFTSANALTTGQLTGRIPSGNSMTVQIRNGNGQLSNQVVIAIAAE